MLASFTAYGIAAALEEIQRRNGTPNGSRLVFERGTASILSFAEAERRLAETMKPARLAPMPETPEAP
jgi:hypothetical protein